MKHSIGMIVTAVFMAGSAWAEPVTNRVYDPCFIGFETDPAMEYGGRDIATLDSTLSRLMGEVLRTDRTPALAMFYELPFALGFSTVQHEVFGHGSRAREYSLDPVYAFGLDFSGSTGLRKDPETMEQNVVIAAGGTEGDSVMAHRLLMDLYTGDGADGSKIPLMFMAKIDVSLYCLITADPSKNPADFTTEYNSGNDVAYYLTARQAQRVHGDPAEVWNNAFALNFRDPLLKDDYNEAQMAALWNLADPALAASLYGYVADHLVAGKSQVSPPVIPLGGGYGLTAGTRAFLGPEEVTRFLDLYLVTPGPLVTVYARDLQNSMDQSFGFGGGLYKIPLGTRIALSMFGDFWKTPESAEQFYEGSGWNACGEITTMLHETVGLSWKLGSKSDGYFPGTPMGAGVYGGAGLLLAF